MSDTQILLHGLSRILGQTLEFDESGQCALEFSEDRLLMIAPLDDSSLSMRVELMDLNRIASAAEQQSLRARALALNFSQARAGMWMAWCESSNTLVLMGVFNRAGDPEDFIDAVEVLLGEALTARAALRDPVPPASTMQAVNAGLGSGVHLRA